MKVGIGGMLHETHTFLPEMTGIETFENDTVARGDNLIPMFRDTNMAMGGFIRACEAEDIDLVPTIYAGGGISGTVKDEVYNAYVGEMIDGFTQVADELDGVLLFLHGAMVTESRHDPEMDVVREVRETVGDTPIVVAMDLHGNISSEMIDVADGICAYQSSPHVDQGETGERAARLLIRTIAGEISPTMAIAKPGLAVPSPFSATTTTPAKDIVSRALTWQVKPELHDVTKWDRKDDVLDVSFFFGFSWSDVPQLGASAIAITDDDPELAEEIVEDVADFAWENREELTDADNLYDTEEAISLAIERTETAEKPILLLDVADRLAETTYVLRELLEQNAQNVAFPLMHDPEAVEVCEQTGEGNEVTVAVGSKTSPRGGGPVEVTGTIEWLGHNPYVATGPMWQGLRMDHGPTAIIRANGVWLQLTTSPDTAGLIDTDPIEQYGYDASSFDIIVSKSKTHFRAVYEDFADEIIIADAPEYSPTDLTKFDYENIPDDLYPITQLR